jgi:phosphatidylserine/phosphatidylglycerophosphate/cardiolipin synthase-like enzyme
LRAQRYAALGNDFRAQRDHPQSMRVIRSEGQMASKAHKRKEPIVISEEDSETVSEASSVMRAPLALLAEHRWKVGAAAGVVVLGLLTSVGIVGLGGFSSSATQYAPSRSAETASAESAGTGAIAAVASTPKLTTCFTPGQDCTGMIVAAIDGAKAEILVQAYSLSAKPLINALGRARLRGVKVRVILDKADERNRDSAGARLIAKRILPQVDTGVASAHNKVMIIDRDTVITGSFNFTTAAQKKNAENVLLIKGHPDITAAYAKNWERRLAASRPYYGTMAPVL